MSTHNIGFHEEITKYTFHLSSNIIKCAFICSSVKIHVGKQLQKASKAYLSYKQMNTVMFNFSYNSNQ